MRYRLLEPLGHGSFGTVYRAEDSTTGKIVALKILSIPIQRSQPATEILKREVALTASLHHPNIVRVLDSGVIEGQHYMAMEFIPGRTLHHELAAHGHLPVPDALYVAAEICRGLAFAHRSDLIHRDIKPTNILVAHYTPGEAAKRGADVKILDFGLAKSIAHASPTSTAMVGTPFYLPPEQIRGEGLDGRADIYALGITLFEMLTGTVPFKTGDILDAHLNTPAPAPSEYVDVLPKSADPIVLRCLEKDPARRYGSAEGLLTAIERLRRKEFA